MSKYKIDLNVVMKDSGGNETHGLIMSRELANAISSQKQGDAVKLYGWIEDLSESKSLELDQSDYDTLKKVVNESEYLNILGKGQLLKVINNTKAE